jgi:hypothetical protein
VELLEAESTTPAILDADYIPISSMHKSEKDETDKSVLTLSCPTEVTDTSSADGNYFPICISLFIYEYKYIDTSINMYLKKQITVIIFLYINICIGGVSPSGRDSPMRGLKKQV